MNIRFDQIAKAVSGTISAIMDDRRRTNYISEVAGTRPYYKGKKQSLTEILKDWLTGNTRSRIRPKKPNLAFIDLHIHPSETTHDSEVTLTELVNKARDIGLDVMGCVCHVDATTPNYNSIYNLLTTNPPEELLERYIVIEKGHPLVQLVDKKTLNIDFNNVLLNINSAVRDRYLKSNILTLENADDLVSALPEFFKLHYKIKSLKDFKQFMMDRNCVHIVDGYELKVEGPENAEILVYGLNKGLQYDLPLDEALNQLPKSTLRIASHVEFIDALKASQAEKLPLKESHIAAALSMWAQWAPARAKQFYDGTKRKYRSLINQISERLRLGERTELYRTTLREAVKRLQRQNTITSSDAHHLYDLGAGFLVHKKHLDFSSGPVFLSTLKTALYKRKHKSVEYVPSTLTFLKEGGAYKIYTACKQRFLSYI
ncbi:MAG: hypothetical protein U9R08_03290 [Nanoarchaeota archaeon]|nr:hypothetical protein [Nanoarchaeota archaeon]